MTTTTMTHSAAAPTADPTITDLLEWMLTDRDAYRAAIRVEHGQEHTLRRLLTIAMASFFVYGLVMSFVVSMTGAQLSFMTGPEGGRPGTLSFSLAYSLGLIGAVGICLPSFYFFALQCGFRPTLRGIVVAIAGGQALTSVFLIGLLPVFAAAILGVELLGGDAVLMTLWTTAGLFMPMVAGIAGARELREWFKGLAATLPPSARARRQGVVEFVGVWSTALYVAVAPVLVYQFLITFGHVGF